MEEEWRDIKGFEGKYQVSNWGRVKSLNYRHTGKERILRPCKDGNGYHYVVLYKEGKHKKYTIHRLVLMTFNPCPDSESLQVNHINECKTDNRLENLEWCTALYNTNYGTHNARVSEKMTNGKNSIPIVQLTLDGKLVKAWKSSHDAKRIGGFKPSGIIACCKNKFNREGNNIYKGYKWCYLYEYISKIDTRIKKIILFDKEYLV